MKANEVQNLFPGVWECILAAVEALNPKEILLFGSRATGKARPTSDFDIGLILDNTSKTDHWATFLAEQDENPKNLYPIDWVNFDQATPDLQKSILTEGIRLYVRPVT